MSLQEAMAGMPKMHDAQLTALEDLNRKDLKSLRTFLRRLTISFSFSFAFCNLLLLPYL